MDPGRAEWDADSLAYFINALGGRRAYETFTEDSFKADAGSREAFEASRQFNRLKDNLYLFGPSGCGKSHLATIAARRFGNGYQTKTVTQMQIAREVRSCENPSQEESVISEYVRLPVLVLDDLGVGKDTEFSLSVLYEVIQGRYMAMRGGLIITSNLGLGDIAEKLGDDRIASRIAGMCRVFHVSGEDRRLSK